MFWQCKVWNFFRLPPVTLRWARHLLSKPSSQNYDEDGHFLWSPSQIKKWASAEWSTYHQNNLSTLKCQFAFTPMGAPTFQIIPPTFFWNPFLVTFWLLRSALCNTLVRANLQHNFFLFSRLLAPSPHKSGINEQTVLESRMPPFSLLGLLLARCAPQHAQHLWATSFII